MYKLPMKETYTMRKLRANIEESLMKITKTAWAHNCSAERTFDVLDNIIDFCELINVYDDNELREIFINMLEEDTKERRNDKEEYK